MGMFGRTPGVRMQPRWGMTWPTGWQTARGPQAAPALTCEPRYTYWRDRAGRRGDHDFSEVATLWHVSGDLRASIKGVLFGRLRDKWAEQTSSQGEVIRAAAG